MVSIPKVDGENVLMRSIEDTKLGDSVVEAMVVSATGNVYWGKVQCQLYEDEDGKDKLGDAFTVYGETYGTEPQKATAVRCED